MSLNLTVWLVILVAFVAANLPFINQRLFAVLPRRQEKGRKGFGLQLLEWLVLYFLAGGFFLLLERNAGQIYPQGWEFYVICICLILVAAFPGFIYRYMWRKDG